MICTIDVAHDFSIGSTSLHRIDASSRCTPCHSPSKLLGEIMTTKLIYDVGMHTGEDTAFYLKKGFRVVAVEANPVLCEKAATRFADAIRDKRLTIVNKAIAREAGPVTFYRNLDVSVWGTIDPSWADRNRRHGTRSETITVDATTMAELLEQFGAPYYMKIDIEGMDMIAVEGLAGIEQRPKYVSIESDKDSFKNLRREIQTFVALGYDRFKIVDQTRVPQQTMPLPAREGNFCEHSFEEGASGLFGEEAPGEWLTAEQAISAYKRIFLRYVLTGDDPFIPSLFVRVLRRVGYRASWHDTHAKRSD
jgi:FkbM family methyltransferase